MILKKRRKVFNLFWHHGTRKGVLCNEKKPFACKKAMDTAEKGKPILWEAVLRDRVGKM